MIIVTTYPLFAGKDISKRSYEYNMYENWCKRAAKKIFKKEGWCTPAFISRRTIYSPYVRLLKYATYGILTKGSDPYGEYPYPIDILQIETESNTYGVQYYYKQRQAEVAAQLLSEYHQPTDNPKDIQTTLQSEAYKDILTERIEEMNRHESELVSVNPQEAAESNS